MIKITRAHFDFFHEYLGNQNLSILAKRHLFAADHVIAKEELKVAANTVDWVSKRLMSASKQVGLITKPRWFCLAPSPPALKFANSANAARFLRAVDRYQRLRKTQLATLAELESIVVSEPKLDEAVGDWLDSICVQHLDAIGIAKLKDLVEFINEYGYYWYRKVPKIGKSRASFIVHWLALPCVSESLGMKLHARALARQKDLPIQFPAIYTAQTDIAPLERFVVPPNLDGRCGTNRGFPKSIEADNDIQAIHEWLGKWERNSNTYRTYRREVERFLAWAILEKGKAVSSLTLVDCQDYRDFLSLIGTFSDRIPPSGGQKTDLWSMHFKIPQQDWIATKKNPRWSPLWRPFCGALSVATQKSALIILNSFMQWLDDHGYLIDNPFKAIYKTSNPVNVVNQVNTERSFFYDEWRVILAYTEAFKKEIEHESAPNLKKDKFYRLVFMLELAYGTGMRLSEMANLRRHHLKTFVNRMDGKTYWYAEFEGKNGLIRKVPFGSNLLRQLNQYFLRRGHASLEEAPPDVPLIAALPRYAHLTNEICLDSLNCPLTHHHIANIFKNYFNKVAISIENADPAMAQIMKRASTHWLRHSYANHALDLGCNLVNVHHILGNRSFSSTKTYKENCRDRRSRS